MDAVVQSLHVFYTKVTYKYVLAETLYVKTDIVGCAARVEGILELRQDGWLIIYKGYACDGPSGPTIDTADFMAGAFIHDALYQLMRLRKLGQEWREAADLELIAACKRAGMPWWRRKYVLFCLRRFAGYAAKPRKETVYRAAA